MKYADHKGIVHRGEYNRVLSLWGPACTANLTALFSTSVAERMRVKDAVQVSCIACIAMGDS